MDGTFRLHIVLLAALLLFRFKGIAMNETPSADVVTLVASPIPELANLGIHAPALFVAKPSSSESFWEFYAANIRNRRGELISGACMFSDCDWDT